MHIVWRLYGKPGVSSVPNEDSRENWQQTFATNPESKKLPLAVVPAHFRRATHVLLATIALHSDYS
jgi:hypothetical protein